MEMDKAQINKIVKQIKQTRSDGEKKQPQKEEMPVRFQVSSNIEKVLIGAGAAAGLAILFDDSKKKPRKARRFYKRFIDNYKRLDSLLDSTVAKQLKKESERQFADEKLENMTIENAVKFDL